MWPLLLMQFTLDLTDVCKGASANQTTAISQDVFWLANLNWVVHWRSSLCTLTWLKKSTSAHKSDLLFALLYRAMATKFLEHFSLQRIFSKCLPHLCDMSLIIVKKERFSEAQHPTWMLKATLLIGVILFWQNVNVLSYIFSVTELVGFAFGSASSVWIPTVKKWLMKICHMEQKRQKQL